MTATPDFATWLGEWADEIEQVQAYTKTDMPTEVHLIQEDISRATRDFPRVGEMLAQAEKLLITSRAAHTMAVREEFPDLTASERRAMVEGRLADISLVRDTLKTTARALTQRHFALMSQRAFEREALRMAGHE